MALGGAGERSHQTRAYIFERPSRETSTSISSHEYGNAVGEDREMIPTGRLRLECAQINPPKPLGFHVQVDGMSVAVLTLEEVRAHCARLDELETARKGSDIPPGAFA
jgi:hypothetical protein